MDRILISELGLRCIIGVNAEERREKQDVVINLVLFTDLRKPGKSDRFEDTVDYRAIKKQVVSMVEDSKFYLIEALAESIAQLCLEHPAITKVQVRVDKPGALRFAKSVAVEIERRKDNKQ